jgi:hypothetical protein
VRKIKLDKIASATRNVSLGSEVTLSDEITAAAGKVVAVRALGRKTTYNEIEDPTGRMVRVDEGDVIAGVLGERRALKGYAGIVPPSIKKGDRLNLLNLGGVIGQCTSVNIELGPPREVEMLGAILTFPFLGERVGVPADVRKDAIPLSSVLSTCAPVIAVAGTCMNAGKTFAASEVVKHLAKRGRRVAAAKLTGVSLRRDTLSMLDRGAFKVLDFADAGAVSTKAGETPQIAKGLLRELDKHQPDAIVVELGDGILGEYGVQDILRDEDFRKHVVAYIMCANDPVAAWGAYRLMKDEFKLEIAVFSGPATDNAVGRDFITRELGVPAINARTDDIALAELCEQRLPPIKKKVLASGGGD